MRKSRRILCAAAAAAALSLALTGCGPEEQSFADFMQAEQNVRQEVEIRLAIISPYAKGSIKYGDEGPEIEIGYYAMSDEEIRATGELDRARVRCMSIMKPALEGYRSATGKEADVDLTVHGRRD